MIRTTIKKEKADLANLFILDNFEGQAQDVYMEEIGTLVFQSALMQYMATQSDDDAKIFESFINENIESESFLEILFSEYPLFEKFLTAEMQAFQSEIFSE